MSFALGELAVRFGCELRGDPELRVAHVAFPVIWGFSPTRTTGHSWRPLAPRWW